MEPHKKLSGIDLVQASSVSPEDFFLKSLEFVRKNYKDQIDLMSSVKFSEVDDDFFFKEYVWVVHASGFSAKAVSRFMPKLIQAYGFWDKMAEEDFEDVMSRVSKVCNNVRKAKAIHSMAKMMKSGVAEMGWSAWRDKSLGSPELLAELPYIGGVTCFHLARNIGMLECVKPDLHLVRMADHWGFKSCVEMCEKIRDSYGEKSGEKLPLGIVDLILWYGASHSSTLDMRRQDGR